MTITKEMVERYYELSQEKKEIEAEMNHLKKIFHLYFDQEVGEHNKGEIVKDRYKLQRQVRKTEKYKEKETIERLEQLNLNELIQIVKKPDHDKIKSAISLGLLQKEDLKGCQTSTYSKAISVTEV